MRCQWSEDERAFVINKKPDRFGFITILKFFQNQTHFPDKRSTIPGVVVDYLSTLIWVMPKSLDGYWIQLTGKRDRGEILTALGIRRTHQQDKNMSGVPVAGFSPPHRFSNLWLQHLLNSSCYAFKNELLTHIYFLITYETKSSIDALVNIRTTLRSRYIHINRCNTSTYLHGFRKKLFDNCFYLSKFYNKMSIAPNSISLLIEKVSAIDAMN